MTENQLKLNLGCGDRYANDWTNIDFISKNELVVAHDLSKGIPYPDNHFDVVYHSHILEHFTRKYGEKFVKECFRVLKPGGMIRIAVPDLEQIAKNYLLFMESALKREPDAEKKYDWTLIEMYDQFSRNESGGEMAEKLAEDESGQDFIKNRCGNFGNNQEPAPWKKMLKKILPRKLIYKIRKIKGQLLGLLVPAYATWKIGKFRKSGEVHQHMYDRFSLGRLLTKTGFKKITQRTASESYIENWIGYNLDTDPDGSIYKPDSIFMEAIK